jgi:outer membrane protein TolC
MVRYTWIFPAGWVALAAWAAGAEAWPAAAERYVQAAWTGNTALQSRALDVEEARARLAEVRSALQPRIDLVARYSRADGGRTIGFPTGDLLNGVYRTLNDYLAGQGRPAAFPQLANAEVPLLRRAEQETKLRVTQPLYRPEIARGVRAARAGVESREAQLAALRRELRLTVLAGYFGHLQAGAAVRILEAAAEVTTEAARVNRVLAEAGKVTEDRVLRAEADALAVAQQLAEAVRDRDLARANLNFLVGRALTTPIEEPAAGEIEALAERLATAGPGAEELSTDGREELVAVQRALDAAVAAESAVNARRQPTLALGVEGGVQGERYRTGGDANYVMGSLVAEVNLWDGHERRSALARAQVERRRAELQLKDTRERLAWQLQQARDDRTAALAGYRAARARATAARGAFDVVQQRDREGLANQLTFLDARNEATRAELAHAIAQQRLLVAQAALDRAAAVTPRP